MKDEMIKAKVHKGSYIEYVLLHFEIVKIPSILLLCLSPVFLFFGIWGALTSYIEAIFCILFIVLGAIFAIYVCMFLFVMPLKATKNAKRLDLNESYVGIKNESIYFYSVFTITNENGKDEKHIDKNECEYGIFKKISDKKDRFFFRSNKQFGNFAFYIWKDTLNDEAIKILESKLTK